MSQNATASKRPQIAVLANKNTRIVYQHIDPAKSRYRRIHNRCGSAWLADVSINQCNIRGRCEWICFSNVSRVCDYVVTPFQERFDESLSDPSRGTSNDCSFPCIYHF